MINRIKNWLKEYPEVIGYLGIAVLLGCIVLYWYYKKVNEIVPTVIPQELARESNIDALDSPEEAVEYFVYALINGDIDQMMRAFPVDELCLKKDFSKILNEKQQFSSSEVTAPSMEYRTYFPLTSAEIVGNYVDMYDEVQKEIDTLEKVELVEISYINPEEQLQPEYQSAMSDKCEMYGAKVFCEMKAILKMEDEYWTLPLTLVNYDGYWKVFQVGGTLQAEIEKSKDYKEEDRKGEEELTKKLIETFDGINFESDMEKNDIPDENQEVLRRGDALLPPNYFVVNSVYGESPEKLMSTFLRYMQRKDFTTVLTLINTGEEEKNLETISIETLSEQGNSAELLQYFCFSFLINEEISDSLIQKDTELSGTELLGNLNPENFFYLELREMIPIDDNNYEVYFKFEGNYYKFEFKFSKFDQGWQIKNIVKKDELNEREYNKEIENLKK